jgi:hypothetical protein
VDVEAERILKDAIQFSEADRAYIADRLYESIGDFSDELELTSEWLAEVDRRTRETRFG